MCKEIIDCIKEDPEFKDWVLSTIHTDLKSNWITRILSVIVVVTTGNIDSIAHVLKEIIKW